MTQPRIDLHHLTPSTLSDVILTVRTTERPDVVEYVVPFKGAVEIRPGRVPISGEQVTLSIGDPACSLSWLVTPATDWHTISAWIAVWAVRLAAEEALKAEAKSYGVAWSELPETAEQEVGRWREVLMEVAEELGQAGLSRLANAATAYACAVRVRDHVAGGVR
jgi:hypothetical protein